MIIIKLKEKEKGLIIDPEDYKYMEHALNVVLVEKKFLRGLHNGSVMSLSANGLEIGFKGVIAPSQEDAIYVLRLMSEMLSYSIVAEFLVVSGQTNRLEPGDKPVRAANFKPENTANTYLLDRFVPNDDIPRSYLCAYTDQVMDDPVYLSTKPDVNYDRSHITYWLYTQAKPFDPVTRQDIDPLNDIISNTALKAEITAYVKAAVKTGLDKKRNAENEIFIQTVKKYAPEVTIDNIDKAFRRAAALNKVEDLQVLLSKVSNINAQDDNPTKRKTALHWAVVNECVDCVKFLLGVGAKTNILDADGMSVRAYAKEAKNPDIQMLLIDELFSSTLSGQMRP